MKQVLAIQSGKFLIVGAISTVINYGFFYVLLNFFAVDYLASSGLGYMVGLVFGYFFNRNWTFESESEHKTREFTSYFFVYMVSLVASLAFLSFLVENLAFDPNLANIWSIGLSTIMNFLGCKFLVFRLKNIL